jgi:hypothetical protein
MVQSSIPNQVVTCAVSVGLTPESSTTALEAKSAVSDSSSRVDGTFATYPMAKALQENRQLLDIGCCILLTTESLRNVPSMFYVNSRHRCSLDDNPLNDRSRLPAEPRRRNCRQPHLLGCEAAVTKHSMKSSHLRTESNGIANHYQKIYNSYCLWMVAAFSR